TRSTPYLSNNGTHSSRIPRSAPLNLSTGEIATWYMVSPAASEPRWSLTNTGGRVTYRKRKELRADRRCAPMARTGDCERSTPARRCPERAKLTHRAVVHGAVHVHRVGLKLADPGVPRVGNLLRFFRHCLIPVG